MPDNMEKVKIPWHPGFYGAAEIEFSANKADLEFHREYSLSKEPLKMDLLIIKKLSDVRLQNEIGWIFKKYNVIEYKSPEDGLTIDDFYKTIGYACLYKGLGTSVNQIPAKELTVSIFRESFPRELFDALDAEGFQKKEQCPGIYYIYGRIPFDAQIIVTSRLDSKTHLSLRILSNRVQEADARAFLTETGRAKDPGARNNVEAVLHVSILANRTLYEEIRRDLGMCEALRELMKDEIEEEISRRSAEAIEKAKKTAEAETRKAIEEKNAALLASIRNLMDSMKWTAEQTMNAMKIPEADRPGYLAKL